MVIIYITLVLGGKCYYKEKEMCMKQKSVLKRVTSIAMIIVMIVTLMPNNLRKVKAETATDPVRRVDDVVELVDGVDRVPMKLYANGMYEAKVNAASGSAIQVEVNGNTVKTSTWESNGKDVYVRYDSKTKEIKNSVANSTSFKTAATWVGALDTIEGAGLSNWNPSDTKADLEYIGGGIYQKQFNFTQLATALELKDEGYKVAYNNGWNNGEVSNDQKVKLTIPANASNITVYADAVSGYITDSVNTPSIAKSISLIGTVRCNDSTNWTPSVTGWEFTNINGEYGVYNQVLPVGNYKYKIVYNHADWPSWGDRSIDLSKETNVVYVYD